MATPSDSEVKNPSRVARGYKGMAVRWKDHVPMSVQLTGLTLDQRKMVKAFVESLQTGNGQRP